MAGSKRTINHEEIKRWAEARDARPAKIKGTGGKEDPGLLRINFPDRAEENLSDISWDEFFQKFDESKLALLYQEQKSNGEVSNFSKLVRRNPNDTNKAEQTNKKNNTKEKEKNTVQSIMSEDVVWCTPKSSLEEAALIMADCDVGEVPVIENENSYRVVGVITDRDITLRSLGSGKDPHKLTVKECMTSPAVTVHKNASIEECLHLMEGNQIRRIVVIDETGACCGIVSQADIIQRTSKEQATELLKEVSKPSDEPSQSIH